MRSESIHLPCIAPPNQDGIAFHILIIRPGALGDTLMLLPSLVALGGKSVITLVARQPGLSFMRDYVHCTMDFESSGWHRLFMKKPTDWALPVSRTDLVVAFFSDEDGMIHRNLNTNLPEAHINVFPSCPPVGDDIHVAQYVSECLKSAGLPIDPVTSLEGAVRGSLFKNVGRQTTRSKIVLHPGSGDSKKNYPPDFWLKVLKRLSQEKVFQGLKPVLLLGPAEKALAYFFGEDLGTMEGEVIFCPGKDDLIALFREAALYLGHDSGITHVASMLGTPTVALFKESDARQWRPLGPSVSVIQNNKSEPELIERVLQAASIVSHK